DPWARLHHDLDAADRGPKPRAVVIAEAGSVPRVEGVRVVTVPTLPAPGTLAAEDLLLAIAGTTGYRLVVRVQGTAVAEIFPGDPLAPFMGGLRPWVRDDGALARLEVDLAAEEALHAAFDAAAAFRYVEAARAAETLSSLIDERDAG